MPKLNGLHIAERLQQRLEAMQRGEAVAIREIKSLLNTEQQSWMDEQWALQQQLRKDKPARTAAAQAALGYKSKRDIQIEALQRACEEASGDQLNELRRLQQQAVVRQGRIYLDTLSKELAKGTDASKAKTIANNNLTRAGLARLDGAKVHPISARDREVWAIEETLRAQFAADATEQEREQQALVQENKNQEKSRGSKLQKQSKK